MDKFQIYICENFYKEYKEAIRLEGFEEVELLPFPPLCAQKGRKSEAKRLFEKVEKYNSRIICSQYCDALKYIPERHLLQTIIQNYCFSHLACDSFLDYLTSQGGYIINSGWLEKWEYHIKNMGFDKETAKRFFQESSKQLIFLDAMKEDNSYLQMQELSSYLGLPHLVVKTELEKTRLLLRSIVYEWRLHIQEKKKKSAMNELRNHCAEYSAVFDMWGKIATFATQRDVVGQIKDLFLMVFGAQSFVFWSNQSSLPEKIRALKDSKENYLLLREENRFCIKIVWQGIQYGIIDVSGFIFPQYIDKYLNLAVEVSKISGLVFHNNEQYEKILDSEKELKYLSYHDSLTQLFNRTYINQIMCESKKHNKTCVFMFDIDKLKYVNDNFGHMEGDKLIKSLATVLRQSFRDNDILARIGGDEFVAILYDEINPEVIKQRIIDLINNLNNENTDEKHLTLSVSIGYAKSEQGNETIENLMKIADDLMYQDKMKKRQH